MVFLFRFFFLGGADSAMTARPRHKCQIVYWLPSFFTCMILLNRMLSAWIFITENNPRLIPASSIQKFKSTKEVSGFKSFYKRPSKNSSWSLKERDIELSHQWISQCKCRELNFSNCVGVCQKTSVLSSTPTTTTLLAAPGIEENAGGVGTGRDLGLYEQETPLIQSSNNQMLQAKRNSASCATAAARRPPFEAPTWRHFAGGATKLWKIR